MMSQLFHLHFVCTKLLLTQQLEKLHDFLKVSLGIRFLMRLKESFETDDAFTNICSSPWQVLTGFPQAYLCGVKCFGIC